MRLQALFPTYKGVRRQGDPFFPLLSNLAADDLSNLIKKAPAGGLA
jgi:hypothetical protein